MKVINGVTFYPAAYEGKTEAEFIEHESHNLSKDELKKAFAILSPKKKDIPMKKVPVDTGEA